MPSLNRVELAGHLTRDPELKYAKTGTAIVNFSIGVSSRRTNKDGQVSEDTQFPRITVFGKNAEMVAQNCRKGSAVYVEGSLKEDRWEDAKTKEKRSSWGVSAFRVWPLAKTEAPPAQPVDIQPVDPPVDPQVGF